MVTNGVKQGGILSPILFAIYMDELFYRLKLSKFGCHIGNKFMGSFGYADDAILLAPSVMSLKLMLHIVDKYGEEFNVKFNPDKCKLLCYSNSKSSLAGIHYKNTFIPIDLSTLHLGNNISTNPNNNNVQDVTNQFIVSMNGILAMFHSCFSNIKYQLFKSYCTP